MGHRITCIVGLAFWFPLLRGEFFAAHFFWPGQGALSPLIYNALVLLTVGGIFIGRHPFERLLREHPQIMAIWAMGAGGLLLPFATGEPSRPLSLLAMVVVALAFCILTAGWGTTCLALHRSSGVRSALLDVAIAYALSYFTLLPGLSGAMPGALRCLCMVVSGAALYLAITTGALQNLPATSPVPPRKVFSPSIYQLVGMYFAVELVSAVLVGVFVPIGQPGSSDPFRSYLSLAIACAVAALLMPWKRPTPTTMTLFVGIAVILIGSLLFMPNIEFWTILGSHVLTAGRRLFWTLFFMLLITACHESPSPQPIVAFGCVFPLAFVATRIPVNALRLLDPAKTMPANGIYGISLALSLLLIACTFGLVWLEALRSRGSHSTLSSGHLDQESTRFAVSQELAKANALTERERCVLELLSRGYTVKRIADELCVSENTVRAHTKAIYRKIGCHSKQELINQVEQLMGEGRTEQIQTP